MISPPRSIHIFPLSYPPPPIYHKRPLLAEKVGRFLYVDILEKLVEIASLLSLGKKGLRQPLSTDIRAARTLDQDQHHNARRLFLSIVGNPQVPLTSSRNTIIKMANLDCLPFEILINLTRCKSSLQPQKGL